MERDGMCTSLWQYDVPQYQSAHTTIPNTFFDIVIVGGGITGVSAAHILQKAGKKCLLLEAHSLGYGTTSGTTAHINTVMDSPYNQIEKNFGEKNAQLVAEVARKAIDYIKQNITEYNIDCGFEVLPVYLFSQDEKQTRELEDITEASIKAGVSIEYVHDIPV